MAIERLLDTSGWSHREIARKMGIDNATVLRIVGGRRVGGAIAPPLDLSPSHLAEIGNAPEGAWQALADRAAEDKWTARETGAAARVLSADDVPQEKKEALLAGEIPPFDARPDEGEPKVFKETLAREAKKHEEAMRNDPQIRLFDALAALGLLSGSDWGSVFDEMPTATARNVAVELDRGIVLLQEIAATSIGKKKLEVVA